VLLLRAFVLVANSVCMRACVRARARVWCVLTGNLIFGRGVVLLVCLFAIVCCACRGGGFNAEHRSGACRALQSHHCSPDPGNDTRFMSNWQVHRPVAAPSRSLQCDCHWLSEPAVRENLIIYWLHAHRQEFPCYRIAGHLRAHPKVALTMTIAVRHGVQKFCVGICFFDMWCSNVWCGDMWCCVT